MIERNPVETRKRILTATEFQRLGEVPPESEWFKNIRETEACIWVAPNRARYFQMCRPIREPDITPIFNVPIRS